MNRRLGDSQRNPLLAARMFKAGCRGGNAADSLLIVDARRITKNMI